MNSRGLMIPFFLMLMSSALVAGCGALNGSVQSSESKPDVVPVVEPIVDTTPPTAVANIIDGTFIIGTTVMPIATWDHATDESAIIYEIAIGTTAGATDVLNWTTKTSLATATHTGLTLTPGTTYFTSVRAVDAAGNIGPATSGDGWQAFEPLVVTPVAKMLLTNERFPFSASGGLAPFSFSKTSGAGTLTGTLFQAPLAAGTSVIKVQDSLANEATATITTRGFEHVLTTVKVGGPDMKIQDTAYDASGTLYVAGYYDNNGLNWLVAKFDGTTWTVLEDTKLSSTYGATPSSILVISPNDIYVAGHLMGAGSTKWIVRHFDGTSWALSEKFEFGSSYSSRAVKVVRGNDGSIYVAGAADESLFVERWVVRKLSGGTWTTSDSYRRSGTSYRSEPHDAAVAPDGTIYVCGEAITGSAGSAEWVVRKYAAGIWTDSEVYGNSSSEESCRAIVVDSSNNVYAAGVGVLQLNELRKWNGTSWSPVGSLTDPDYTHLTVTDMQLDSAGRPVVTYLGYVGFFEGIDWVVGRFEPTPTLLHKFTNGEAYSIAREPSGNLVVGGLVQSQVGGMQWHLRKIGASSFDFLAEYQITKPTGHVVNDSAYDSNGNLYSVGYLETQPGMGTNVWNVRKFDGTTWTDVDTFSLNKTHDSSEAKEILIDSSDNVYVVGHASDDSFESHWIVRKFNGTSWSTHDDHHPALESMHEARAIVSHGGSIYVAGWNLDASDEFNILVRRFDGTTWSNFQTTPLDPLMNSAEQVDMVIDSSNNVWIAAAYLADSYSVTHIKIFKFDGTSWTTSDSNTTLQSVYSLKLAQAATGEIFQSYTASDGSMQFGNVRLFDGTSWTDYDRLGVATSHSALKSDSAGNVYFGGVGWSGPFIKKWNGYFFDEVYKPSVPIGYMWGDISSLAFGSSGQMSFSMQLTHAMDQQRRDSALYRLAP